MGGVPWDPVGVRRGLPPGSDSDVPAPGRGWVPSATHRPSRWESVGRVVGALTVSEPRPTGKSARVPRMVQRSDLGAGRSFGVSVGRCGVWGLTALWVRRIVGLDFVVGIQSGGPRLAVGVPAGGLGLVSRDRR